MNVLYRYLLTAVLLATGMAMADAMTVAAQESDPRAEEIADRIRARYGAMDAMSAWFVQTLTSEFMEAPERFSGTLLLQDQKYRIETGGQTIVTDGVVTWIHNRAEGQVLLNDFVEDESTFSLTVFLRQFDRDYDYAFEGTETLEGAVHDVLDLTSRDVFATFQEVRMWVRQSDGVITRLRVVDLNDVEMLFRLSDIRFDPPITEETFHFEPPAGVEIIDLRN